MQTGLAPNTLFHVLLSILTFAVLSFAGLLTLMLWVQEWLLKYRPAASIMQKWPPIESMESILFQAISLGFVLLTILLLTSIYFYHDLIWQQSMLMQKTVITFLAWLIFAVLLLGRFYWGWRGRKAMFIIFVGLLLLAVIYYGSRLMMGFFQ